MSNIFEINDEIVEIEYIGEEETIDINVSGNKMFYANDILTHNSSTEEIEFDHSHIAGGISKINTADTVIGIFSSRALKERDRIQIQLMKTRSSNGVGAKIDLGLDGDSMRIVDLGEEGENPDSSHISHITEKLKKKTVVMPGTDHKLETDELGVTTVVTKHKADGAKLRSMLSSISDDD